MLTLLHTSDLQIGKPYRPHAAEALVRAVEELCPDVVVVAGDLTQRAKVREYQTARALLARLGPAPVVVTPGNHDVPLYRVWERLIFPYRNWRRFVSDRLDSVLHVPGAMVVALNSSAPRRAIVGGRLDRPQIEYARRAFAEAEPTEVRILVVHHHFVVTDDGTGGTPLPRARWHLDAFADMGIDLLLGGHVHQTRVLVPPDPRTGAPFPVVSCGTTTSWRGRGPETDLNTMNLIRIDAGEIVVVPHLLSPERDRFEPREPFTLPRYRDDARRGDREPMPITEDPRGER
jgi:3',5'-cyclic AMP phosphodiesterase CpdA